MRVKAGLFALAVCLWPLSTQAATTQPDDGKQLYRQGTREAGELTAYVGRGSIAMTADTLPCVNCHGRDGRGRPEGGVKPSDITWAELSKAYGGTSKSGRHYGTYNEDTFLRAVTEGIDAAGQRLDTSMPRYNISRHDARNLIQYLQTIADEYDPGISDDAVVFTSLQMQEGWQAELGAVITSTIEAYFADINRQGGVYGRKLQLQTLRYADSKAFGRLSAEVGASDKTFALLGTLSGNVDEILVEQAERSQLPSIAPFTNQPAGRGEQHRYSFYIYGGLASQVHVLIKRMLKAEGAPSRVLVVYRDAGPYQAQAREAVAALRQQGNDAVEFAYHDDKSPSLQGLPKLQAARVLFIGAGSELVELYPRLLQTLRVDGLYLPGMLVSSQIMQLPAEALDRLEVAYHSTPDEEGKLEDFYRFLHEHGFGRRSMSIRLFAYSAARIAVEGLKRAGKRLSREKVIAAMEQLFDFDAGLNRPIRYGSSRRVALQGAYIVKLDRQQNRLKSTGYWVELE